MMIGFKTGLKNWPDGQKIVEEFGGKMCEIWYNIHTPEVYQPMISWLEERDVTIGLHHWGVAGGKYKTNLATPHHSIRSETMQQIKDTIMRAAKLKRPAYVNAHPGSYMVEIVDLTTGHQSPKEGTEVSSHEANQLFLDAAEELFRFAHEKGVVLTLETLPAGEQYTPENRERFYVPTNIPLDIMRTLTEQGGYIANDLTHSTGQIAYKNTDMEQVWNELLAFTQSVSNNTRLLHVNTVVPPYNGTDSHSGITTENFALDCFPKREQLKQILSIFKDREDMYVVTEPEVTRTIENYQALTELVSELQTQ